MRLKVDENLPRAVCDLLQRAGHDAISVGEQGLSGEALLADSPARRPRLSARS